MQNQAGSTSAAHLSPSGPAVPATGSGRARACSLPAAAARAGKLRSMLCVPLRACTLRRGGL